MDVSLFDQTKKSKLNEEIFHFHKLALIFEKKSF